ANLPALIETDKVKLTRVISNLLSNAIKFSPAASVVQLVAAYEAHTLQVKVSDQGKGIAPERQRRLFTDPFTTESNELMQGTGIGLVIVKQLLDGMGGTVEVKSRVDEGTTFMVRVPAAVSKDAHAGAPDFQVIE